MKIIITDETYDKIKASMKSFLVDKIKKACDEIGGKRAMSAKLGKSHTHVEMIMRRSAFSALERLYKEIKEKELDKKEN